MTAIIESSGNSTTVKLQGSNDNNQWVDVKTWTCNVRIASNGLPYTQQLIETSYRYLRGYVNNISGQSKGQITIIEIK